MDGPVKTSSLADLKARIGEEVGVSDWFVIDQKRIDAFADITDDHQFIHVNPEMAKMTPWGQTIAHGFLTLSLTAAMGYQGMPAVEGARMGMNYGCNKLRFLSPVRSGKRVRGHYRLLKVEEQPGGRVQLTAEVTVEIEGEEKPALVAEWLTLIFV
jgi:acyl dehydratase